MIVVVIAAVFGAALGLLMREQVLALAVAVLTVGTAQIGAMFVVGVMAANQQYALMAETLSGYVGKGFWAVAPTVAASGAGAVLAAVMLMLMRLDRSEITSLPGAEGEMPRTRDRNGKLRRAEGMIEDRPIHEAAESRIDQILKL